MAKLYFVRHGESTANILGVFSNQGYKHPLTEKGIQQAEELANELSGLKVEQIYSSPIMRAEQTARILSSSLAAPIELSEALREWDVGIYEGTTDPVGWELHAQVWDDWSLHQKYDSKMPGGEDFYDVRKRFVPFIEGLIGSNHHKEQNLLLVSHGGLYMVMLPVIFKNVSYAISRQYKFPNTGYAVAETRPEGLFCISWCGMTIDQL